MNRRVHDRCEQDGMAWLSPPEQDNVHESRGAAILRPLLLLLMLTSGLISGSTLFVDWILPFQQGMILLITVGFGFLLWVLRRGHLRIVVISTIGLVVVCGVSSSLLDSSSSVYPLPFVVAIVLSGLTLSAHTSWVMSLVFSAWVILVHFLQAWEVFEFRRPLELGAMTAAQVFIFVLIGAIMTVANIALKRAFESIDMKEAARRQLENDLYQAQKLEAIGRLAGGFAHDFNNLLGVVMMNADFLQEEELSSDGWQSVQDILVSSQAGSVLTSKLLALGRKQVVQSKILDPGRLVHEFGSVLGHMAGRDNPLDVDCSMYLGKIKMDPHQLQQILSNLVINASHASPAGEPIRLELEFKAIEERHVGIPDVVGPGEYICLKVVDKGTGMDKQTLESAFEPFFTTKESGIGTGLGLSVVLGIVRQSGGWVTVSTEVGQGTEFTLWFPLVEAEETWEPAPVRVISERAEAWDIQGLRVVFVDDDEPLRLGVTHALRSAGALIDEFGSGEEAIVHIEKEGFPEILLTDCRMPGMTGPELVDGLQASGYTGPVIYFTGFAGSAEVQVHLDRADLVLRKPLSAKDLVANIGFCIKQYREKQRLMA